MCMHLGQIYFKMLMHVGGAETVYFELPDWVKGAAEKLVDIEALYYCNRNFSEKSFWKHLYI